jgi:hypothetical protein
MWRLSMGQNQSLSARLPASSTRSRDQAAPVSGQVELVAVLNLAAGFDDDVGVRLEQADDLLVGGDRLAMKDATCGLRDNLLVESVAPKKLTRTAALAPAKTTIP